MTSKLYVTEYPQGPSQHFMSEPGVDQVVDYSGGAAASTAFVSNTAYVRVATDSICSIKFGTAPVATTSNRRLAAGESIVLKVPQGQAFKVSAIINT